MKVTDSPTYILRILIWSIKKVNRSRKELLVFVVCSIPLPVPSVTDSLTDFEIAINSYGKTQVQFNPHFHDDDSNSKTCVGLHNLYGKLMDFKLDYCSSIAILLYLLSN